MAWHRKAFVNVIFAMDSIVAGQAFARKIGNAVDARGIIDAVGC